MITPDPTAQNKEMLVWGRRFQWTTQHTTADELRPLLFSYDKLAEDALDKLDEISPPPTSGWKCPHGSGPGQRDLYALLEEHAPTDAKLGRLWDQVTHVPDWVDWEQIERGQRLVYQFNGQILLGLLYKSLVGGMGASNVVETLSRTGGFGLHVTRRRLLETLQHFMDVVVDLDAVKPGGKGFVSSVRVRMLHAAVRRRIMRLERERPGYFDVQALGVPINDLHCIGTVSVYSSSIVYTALPRQGVFLSRRQIADYLALWRWVGHVLGAPVDWMATPESARAMMESVMAFEMHPSAASRVLANNILTAEADTPPLFAPRGYLAAQAHRMNGRELAEGLGIERPSLRHLLLVWVQCLVLLCLSYSYPLLTVSARRRRDHRFRELVHTMITSQKLGGIGEPTKFEFQYVPAHGKTTELGAFEASSWDVAHDSYIVVSVLGLVLVVFTIFHFISEPRVALPQAVWSLLIRTEMYSGSN